MPRIFEDRLVTIQFVIPGFVMQSTEEQQAADAAMWLTYTSAVERALRPLHPLMTGFSIVNEKRDDHD